jgi:hypothetical protein
VQLFSELEGCLHWHESGVYFGARDIKTKWNPGKAKELHQLFRELEKYRHPKLGIRCFERRQSAG